MSVAIHFNEGSVRIGGTGDLAELWDVTTQRVRQLAARSDFPPALGQINGAPVYDVDECDGWRQITRRRPGRHRPETTASIDPALKELP